MVFFLQFAGERLSEYSMYTWENVDCEWLVIDKVHSMCVHLSIIGVACK